MHYSNGCTWKLGKKPCRHKRRWDAMIVKREHTFWQSLFKVTVSLSVSHIKCDTSSCVKKKGYSDIYTNKENLNWTGQKKGNVLSPLLVSGYQIRTLSVDGSIPAQTPTVMYHLCRYTTWEPSFSRRPPLKTKKCLDNHEVMRDYLVTTIKYH